MRAIASWLGLDRPALVYALSLFVAATAAFSVASLLQIPNAYWAAMPIWVVAQPQRGVLLERAIFRVLGTLLGAGVGFGILQLFSQPLLVLAVLCLWIGLSSGLTHVLHKFHAYIALMAGITAAVVVLPSLLLPGQTYAIALARVECTLIGVIMVTLITGLFTPKVRRAAFYRRVRTLAGDAVAHVAELLRSGEQDAAERRILAQISDVETASALAVAGSIDGYRRNRHVNAFIAASIALMAEGKMLLRRRSRTDGNRERLPETLSAFANRLRSDKPQKDVAADLQQLIASAGLANTRLAALLEQLVAAESALFAADYAVPASPSEREAIGLAPHYEWKLARRTGLVSGSVTFAAAAAGLLSGWADAELAALGVCLFSMILGSLPKPQVVAPEMLKGVASGVLLAVCYRFAIQPHIATIPQLIASMAPFLLLGALARVSRKTAVPAIDANMCFLLASQAVLPALPNAPFQILSGAAALILAAIMVTGSFILLPRDSVSLASNAAREIVSDLRRLALPSSTLDAGGWRPRALRQILRLMLHLGRASNLRATAPQGMLAALNLGNAIVDIQTLSSHANPETPDGQTLAQALGLLADFDRDPDNIAQQLVVLAQRLHDGAATDALQDAAHALQQSAALIAMGRNQKI